MRGLALSLAHPFLLLSLGLALAPCALSALPPAAEPLAARDAALAAELAAVAAGLPRDGLLLSPIPGLTTAWHPAPEAIAVPMGTRIRFLRATHPRVTVKWQGAREIYRDARWSVAEARFDEPGERTIGVDYVIPTGQVLADRVTVSAIDLPATAFRVVDVILEPAVGSPRGAVLASVAALSWLGDGRYRTAIGTRLRLVARTEPAAFSTLVEWRDDGVTRLEIGDELALTPDRTGTRTLAAGPPDRAIPVAVEVYRTRIVPPVDLARRLAAGESLAFRAMTEPPGHEGEVTWSVAAVAPASPTRGQGAEFVFVLDPSGDEPSPRDFTLHADSAIFSLDADAQAIEEGFTSTAKLTATLDPGDSDCSRGLTLEFTSVGLLPAVVSREPPPYASGRSIGAEMTQLELGAFHPLIGHVIVRERADRVSAGRVDDVVAGDDGEFLSGHSSFDMFIELEMPEMGLAFDTGDASIHMDGGIVVELPPIDNPYQPVAPEPLPLLDRESRKQVGWLCHTSHTPRTRTRPHGGATTPGGRHEDWFQSTGQTTLSLSTAVFAPALRSALGEAFPVEIALDSEGLRPATVVLDSPPYEPGQVVATEMVRLELGGSAPGVGPVVIREREDRFSRGQVVVEAVDADGNLVAGYASFDLFLNVELPASGTLLHTGMTPIHVTAYTVGKLPPVGAPYEHDEDDAVDVPLYNYLTLQPVGTVVAGNHWVTKPVPCTTCEADLDLDSDNDNGINPPDRSAYEELIEENPPGKYIGLDNDDDDNNKIRDFNEEPIKLNPPENDPVPMVIELKPNRPPDQWTLTYPAQVQVYDGNLIIPSGVKQNTPLVPNPKTLRVEGVLPSTVLGDVLITLTYECITTDEYGYAHTEIVTDKVKATVITVDLDADSDNSNTTADFGPGRTNAEDDIEDHDDKPGRLVPVNSDDDDNDNVLDRQDGYNFGAGAADDANAAENDFVRVVLEVPVPVDLNLATLRFTYSASDPSAVNPAGRLRIWKKNGNAVRNKARASAGGDYVHTGDVYTALNLGLGANRTVNLWLEGIQPSLATSDRILVELDPDGPGKAGWVTADAMRVTVVGLAFIDDADAAIPSVGDPARLMVSNMVTSQFTNTVATAWPRAPVVFDPSPTGDVDLFRAEISGAPAGANTPITLEVLRPDGTIRSTANYPTVKDGATNRHRTSDEWRLVSNAVDDAHGANASRLGRIDAAAAGDRVRARATIAGQAFSAELPLCRPLAETNGDAIRTAVNYFVVVDIAGTTVAANAAPGTTNTRMTEAWTQCCVRFSHSTQTRAPVTNLLRVVGNATGAGTVSLTMDGTAVGPIAIPNGSTAYQIAGLVRDGINTAIAGANAAAFNSFPPTNTAHVAGRRGANAALTALVETVPTAVVSVPALNFADGIEVTNEEPALAANFGDQDANTLDFFIVDTLASGNRGDAWPVCNGSIGGASDLRNNSFIVLTAGDAAADNPHTAAHEAGRFILNYCGLHASAFNLQAGTSVTDAVTAAKRLEAVQCATARTTSDGTILKQQ